MKLLFILVFVFPFAVLAQTCTTPPAYPRMPVIDQDGISTCAAASSALMIQMNITDASGTRQLNKTPSYLQMSIFTGANNPDKSFYKVERSNGSVTTFNSWMRTCEVLDSAMKEGFCDSENFPLDFLGKQDSMGSQQKSIEMIAKYLNASNQNGELPDLITKLQVNGDQTKDLIAHLMQKSAVMCRQNPKEFIVRNAFARRKRVWTAAMNRPGLTPAQKSVYQNLLAKTFGPGGELTPAALAFGKDDYFQRGFAAADPDKVSTIGEGLMSVHWALHLGMDGVGFLGVDAGSEADAQADFNKFKFCQYPLFMAVQEYMKNPDCPLPSDVVPQSIRDNVDVLSALLTKQDPRKSIVALISPKCADQARRRRIENYRCNEKVVNAGNDAQARQETFSELCSGRAVSMTVCPMFARLTGPWNSDHCSKRVSGESPSEYHAYTAISFRQNGAKRQVLIQNSFGNQCQFATDGKERAAFAGLVECERNADGVFSGRFWVDEDLLFNNTASVVTFKQ